MNHSVLFRSPNTTSLGVVFSLSTRQAAWLKGSVIPEYPASMWRRDEYGRAIKWDDYGRTDTKYGWEVDHIVPVERGGGDQIANLRPLFWETNRRKGDTYPWYPGQ